MRRVQGKGMEADYQQVAGERLTRVNKDRNELASLKLEKAAVKMDFRTASGNDLRMAEKTRTLRSHSPDTWLETWVKDT